MFIRYEQPDERGKTRRERNEDVSANGVDVVTPEFEIPEYGDYLWLWYHELSDALQRVSDGVCLPIPWTEYEAWHNIAGHEVRVAEFGVLRAMDIAFCSEMNKELKAFQDKRNAQQAAEIEAAKRGK